MCPNIKTNPVKGESVRSVYIHNIQHLNPSCTKIFGTHTFYKGGGGGGADPHGFGNDRLYDLQLWQAIRPIYERENTGGVDDLNLVRFPCQLFYLRVFSTKFC